MLSRHFRIVIVLVFFLTTSLIVVLQYNANRNIDELVAGNESLLSEFKMRSHLQKFQKDLQQLDHDILALTTGKKNDNINIEIDVSSVKASVAELEDLLVTENTKHLWNQLNVLTNDKIDFSYRIVDSLRYSGKPAAEALIKQQKAIELNEALASVSNKLDVARQNDLEKIIRKTDTNSLNAKGLQALLAVTAIIIVMFTLWYVVSRIRKQHEMINQLNESERKVKEAALIKEHFIANMSHEIRTPLNAIIGFTGLLQKQKLEPVALEYVTAINNSGENLLSIVNDVLDLSKIEAGMMRIETVAVNLTQLLESVFAMFKPKAKEKQLEFLLQIHTPLPPLVTGDPVRITQILVNLVSNAIKFTEKGFVKIDVQGQQQQNQLQVCIKVTDSGIGVPPLIKEQIFERFTQADEEITRKYGGTGLGLSIVKQIVLLLNGSIEVESAVAKGSVFTVLLPFAVENNPSAIAPAPLPVPVLHQHNNVHILVVEDNPMNQSLLKHLLAAWNHKATITANGKEAIAALKTQHFDLILMDIQMPEMDGYTATAYIRNQLALHTPIIAMTAHALAGEKEKCISLGMNDYLAKPIRENLLNELLHRYLTDLPTPQPSTAQQNSYIDLEYLNDIAKGNKNFRLNILQQFTVQAPEEIELLEAAYYRNDHAAVKKLVHHLKTTISFLGLGQRLQKDIDVLYERCEKRDFNEASGQAISDISLVCNHAIKEAEKLLLASVQP